MGLTETFAFYLVVGMAVSTAVVLSNPRQSRARLIGLALSGVVFWPLYLPMLLSQRTAEVRPDRRAASETPDALAIAIAQVERELDAALSGLGGWAEHALASESPRLVELRLALAAQAARIRDMDVLLDSTMQEPDAPQPELRELQPGEATQRRQASFQARAQNLARLQSVRDQTYSDLLATLAWIRELVSMVHLAKFTGAPASRAEELVTQIAAAIEGVSAVTWKDEPPQTGPRASGAVAPTAFATRESSSFVPTPEPTEINHGYLPTSH